MVTRKRFGDARVAVEVLTRRRIGKYRADVAGRKTCQGKYASPIEVVVRRQSGLPSQPDVGDQSGSKAYRVLAVEGNESLAVGVVLLKSEERRVGKECR